MSTEDWIEDDDLNSVEDALTEYYPHMRIEDPYAEYLDEYEYLEEELLMEERKAAHAKIRKLQDRDSELVYSKTTHRGNVKATKRDRLDDYLSA